MQRCPSSPLSDQEGRFEVSGFGPGKVTVAARRGGVSPWVIAEPANVTEDLVITMPERFTLSLDVQDQDGNRIKLPTLLLFHDMEGGGPIIVSSRYASGYIKPLDLTGRLQIAEEGRAVVQDLDAGRYVVMVRGKGFCYRSESIDLDKDAVRLIKLEPSVPITTRVVDQDQKPIRNAMVVGVHDEQFTSGLTDADGRFMTERFRGGPLNVSASHPKYGSASGAVEAGRNEVLIQLKALGAIDGLLTEAGATPTPGKWIVTVRSDRDMAPQILSRPVTPDIDGRFKVEGPEPGTYSVLATEPLRTLRSPGEIYTSMSEGRMEARRSPVSVLVSAGQRASVHLTTEPEVQNDQGPSARVTGVVTVNGQPVSGLVVSANTVTAHLAYTTERGHFDLGRIAEGDHTLRVHTKKAKSSKGHLSWIDKISVVANQDKDLQIVFQTGKLTGTVHTADGTALEGCTIWVFGILNGALDTLMSLEDFLRIETETDGAGGFELSSVPEGTYTVIATKEGLGMPPREDVRVEPGSVVKLALRVEQTYRLAGLLDMAVFGDRAQAIRMTLRNHGKGLMSFDVRADLRADGSFEVGQILPGEYEVCLWVDSQEAGADPSHVEWTVVGSSLRIGSADSLDVVLRPVRRMQPVEQGR